MSTFREILCPGCGQAIQTYLNPVPTVDVIIEYAGGIVLISRKNPPFGWALPGGFVDYGETVEAAAVRGSSPPAPAGVDEVFHKPALWQA